jgi:hypothetical protein
MTRVLTVTVSVILAGAVAACSASGTGSSLVSSSPSPASASPTTATTASSSGTNLIPPGRYTAEIPEGVEASSGRWTMEVTQDAILWTNPETGSTFSPGEVVEVTSTRIVFAPDPGCPDQVGEPTEGSYEWSWGGGQLSFTLESDSCLGRSDTLTTAPWEPTP